MISPSDPIPMTSSRTKAPRSWSLRLARIDGIGIKAGFAKDDLPIRGVAILNPRALDLVLIATRLPAEVSDLAPLIIQRAERDAQKGVK